MGYKEALEAAGANVLAYEEFGSYQGDWLAKVSYQGETFWLRDYYGSCTGCDAFEADIGMITDDDGNYIWEDDHPKRVAAIAAFGARYLEPQERLTFDQVMEKAAENVGWDDDAGKMVQFVKDHADA